jgi:hypothetical protein
MKLLKEYFDIQKKIHEYFGYEEDWVSIPLNDLTKYFWILNEQDGFIRYAETIEDLYSDGNYYEDEIYTQRHLPKWVYYGKDFTLICADTHTDGNKFLHVFKNSKKREEK